MRTVQISVLMISSSHSLLKLAGAKNKTHSIPLRQSMAHTFEVRTYTEGTSNATSNVFFIEIDCPQLINY